MEELKPCPFCDGNVITKEIEEWKNCSTYPDYYWAIGCETQNCFAAICITHADYYSEEEAE